MLVSADRGGASGPVGGFWPLGKRPIYPRVLVLTLPSRERYANPSFQFSEEESVVATVRAACDPVTGTDPALSSRGCNRIMIERWSNTG